MDCRSGILNTLYMHEKAILLLEIRFHNGNSNRAKFLWDKIFVAAVVLKVLHNFHVPESYTPQKFQSALSLGQCS